MFSLRFVNLILSDQNYLKKKKIFMYNLNGLYVRKDKINFNNVSFISHHIKLCKALKIYYTKLIYIVLCAIAIRCFVVQKS